MLLLAWACATPTPVEPPTPVTAPVEPAVPVAVAPPEQPRTGPRIGGEPILDRPVVLGGVANEAVVAAVEAQSGRIAACRPGATPKGKILVKFTIGSSGLVTAAEIRSSSVRDAAIEGCVLDVFRQLDAPKPPGGGHALVQYPLSFD